MTTVLYENEKLVLKLYIRLLLYVNNKYDEIETSKIDDVNSYLGYLEQQVRRNKIRNDEIYNNDEALDRTYHTTFMKVSGLGQGQGLGQGLVQGLGQGQGPEEGQGIEEELFIPPFTQLTDELGRKEVKLTDEEMNVVTTIKSHPEFVKLYDILWTLPIESQLKFIERAKLIFTSNKWNKETPYKPENVEALLELIPNPGDIASMKVRGLGLIKDTSALKLARGQALRPAVRGPVREVIKIEESADIEAGQLIPPFAKSSNVSGKEVLLQGTRQILVKTIKENTTLQNVFNLLARQPINVQLKFMEIAAPEFSENKWNIQTKFTNDDLDKVYAFITRALTETEFRSPFAKLNSSSGKELELNEKEIIVVTTIKNRPELEIVYTLLSESGLSLEFISKFIKQAAETFTTKNWNSTTVFSKPDIETILQIITNLAENEDNKKLEERLTSARAELAPAQASAQVAAASAASAQASAPASAASASAVAATQTVAASAAAAAQAGTKVPIPAGASSQRLPVPPVQAKAAAGQQPHAKTRTTSPLQWFRFTNEAQKKAERDDRRASTHELLSQANTINKIRLLLGHITLKNFTQFMKTNTDEDIKKLHTTYNIKTITESLSKFLETFETERNKPNQNIFTQAIVTQAFKRALYPIIVISIPGDNTDIHQVRQKIITKMNLNYFQFKGFLK